MAFHGMIGRKLGMTQIFSEDGTAVPVTVLEMAPNAITQVRTQDTDGYTAVQVAYGERKEKNLSKPELGHFKKAGVAPAAFVREFRVPAEELEVYEAGAHVTVCCKGNTFSDTYLWHSLSKCLVLRSNSMNSNMWYIVYSIWYIIHISYMYYTWFIHVYTCMMHKKHETYTTYKEYKII